MDAAEVSRLIQSCFEASRPVYPAGGRTALGYGNARAGDGLQLDLTGLNKVVDYTPRDMTILVEAGVRMSDLAATLATEAQHLPIDVPRAAEATLGGVVATNWSGPRRYGYGTIRDYVIGIHAVDGRGVAFKGGGRVVKNVAGYDFCKLLTGSLGTLAVITRLALKLKPQPEATATIFAACADLDAAENMLARLTGLPAPPVAIDLLVGTARNLEPANSGGDAALVVRLEGTAAEVTSLADQTQYDLWSAGGTAVRRLEHDEANLLWARQIEFAERGARDTGDNSPLVAKIAVPPRAVTRIIGELLAFDPECAIQSHAGNGIVIARFSKFGHADLTNVLVGKLRPRTVALGGSLVVVSSSLEGLTPHLVWGGRSGATILAERVKRQFDPRNILNPGQFVYD